MSFKVVCTKCNNPRKNEMEWKCNCGAPFKVVLYDKFKKDKIIKSIYSIWRYRNFYPYVKKEKIVSLGEGWTPLVKVKNNLWLKLEYLMPTGSFKDRGSSVLISGLLSELSNVKSFSEDSSGNAGASMAAYCAKAGVKIRVFVPEKTSGPKILQIASYGAQIFKVNGSREEVSAKAQEMSKEYTYIGHAWHPYFRDGIRTLAYEVAEQTNWKLFERVYLPVSSGTLLLGFMEGLRHMCISNVINSIPKVVASQTTQVSPVYRKLKNLHYSPPSEVKTVADALVNSNPPLLEEMTKIMKEIDGDAEVVNEEEIIKASILLARNGFYVEPSAAVAFAAYLKHLNENLIKKDEKTLIILTGIGLKTHFT
ncbi:MAG: pyridoxal-phosphate dependent enzyme [Thermoproteota archaeon]